MNTSRAGAFAHGYAGAAVSRSVISATANHAVAAGSQSHGGLFGSPVTGTEAVFALLIADWALLVAALMWRYRRRLLFPRAV